MLSITSISNLNWWISYGTKATHGIISRTKGDEQESTVCAICLTLFVILKVSLYCKNCNFETDVKDYKSHPGLKKRDYFLSWQMWTLVSEITSSWTVYQLLFCRTEHDPADRNFHISRHPNFFKLENFKTTFACMLLQQNILINSTQCCLFCMSSRASSHSLNSLNSLFYIASTTFCLDRDTPIDHGDISSDSSNFLKVSLLYCKC